jgi:hypothetical protein
MRRSTRSTRSEVYDGIFNNYVSDLLAVESPHLITRKTQVNEMYMYLYINLDRDIDQNDVTGVSPFRNGRSSHFRDCHVNHSNQTVSTVFRAPWYQDVLYIIRYLSPSWHQSDCMVLRS